MRKKQVNKSEQIAPNLSLTIDYDMPLRSTNDILNTFNKYLNNACEIEKFNGTKIVYKYCHNGITDYFLTGAITYLSKPHPIFKKRLQLKKWFKDFYDKYKYNKDTRIHLIGIYHYEELVVFVEFNIEDYVYRKMNSSAAHVYINDIYQAITNEVFKKTDRNGNHVVSIAGRNFNKYLSNNAFENDLFSIFRNFNNEFNFNEWIQASDAIIEMKNDNWYQWRGAEWPGWLLEYKISKYLREKKYDNYIVYIGNKKDASMLDFDLFFVKGKFYGDLKSSDINEKNAPGNDQENVLSAINRDSKIWYIIYEHETIKDIHRNNEMAIARMKLIGEQYKPGDKISYSRRMKHSVKFKKMNIFELNRINMNDALRIFNQGHQPDGNFRKPKFLINKTNIDNCIVFSYKCD